jgi:hypothetical protein
MRCAVGLVLVFLFCGMAPARAASAVAVWVEEKTNKWNYGYWKGSPTEAEARARALRVCASLGALHPTILASTSKSGYGAVVIFEVGDKKPRFVASLGAATEQQAITLALARAKAAGGRYARVMKTWNDVPEKTPPLIKLR